MTLAESVKLATTLASQVTNILPPVTLLDRCRSLAQNSSLITHRVIGTSGQGRPIDAFEIGTGKPTLWYGFPDPGEAVGGTTILTLLQALAEQPPVLLALPFRWCFVPVIDLDLQPDEGKTLQHVMSEPGARLVDMCMEKPRPETLALLGYAREHRPIFTFPLHDEFHSGEAIPGYAVVSSRFPADLAADLRQLWQTFDYPAEPRVSHPSLGPGFYAADEDEALYRQTTQAVLERFGRVLVFEVSPYVHLSPADLVAMQLAAGLRTLAAVAGQHVQSLSR